MPFASTNALTVHPFKPDQNARHERYLQDPFSTVEIAQLPVQRTDDGRGQQVRGHHPREVLQPAEVADDRRQRRRHDRLIERRDEQHEKQRAVCARRDILIPGRERLDLHGRQDGHRGGRRREPGRRQHVAEEEQTRLRRHRLAGGVHGRLAQDPGPVAAARTPGHDHGRRATCR